MLHSYAVEAYDIGKGENLIITYQEYIITKTNDLIERWLMDERKLWSIYSWESITIIMRIRIQTKRVRNEAATNFIFKLF